MATIQLPVPSPLITAGDFSANVLDPGSGTPTNVIRTEDPWAVHASGSSRVPIVPILNGRWRLQVALESDRQPGHRDGGPRGPRGLQAGHAVGRLPEPGACRFHAHVNFPAGTPPLGGAADMVYHCSAMLTYLTPANTPGPFAAVIDLGLVPILTRPKP